MLDQSRFLAMKNLAKDVRKENEEKFKSFDNESVDEAIKDKDRFIKDIIGKMGTSFSEGAEGKEERQIFRANLLIPDDVAFFQAYSKDKNVRNLMNKYYVNIEDIMSKITELNLYSKYIDIFNEEVKEQEEADDFGDSMVDLSKDEADDLLNEIEDLSLPADDKKAKDKKALVDELFGENETADEEAENEEIQIAPEPVEEKPQEMEEPQEEISQEIEEPQIEKIQEEVQKPKEEEIQKGKPKKEEKIPTEPKDDKVVDITIEEDVPPTSPDVLISDEIENISSAVSEFVDEYSKVKRELEFMQAKVDKFNTEKEDLRKKLNAAKDENEAIVKENEGLRNDIERFYQQTRKLTDEKVSLQNKLDEAIGEVRRTMSEKTRIQEELDKVMYEAEKLASENDILKAKMNSMEETVKQSTALLREIYKTIPKKRFNVK